MALEVKDTQYGKGCFAIKQFDKNELIGFYPGHTVAEKTLSKKLSKLSSKKQQYVLSYVCQNYLYLYNQKPKYIDPTDGNGELHRKFTDNPILYCNEPNSLKLTNANVYWNLDTMQPEIKSSCHIKPGDEILLCYGKSYNRDYSINDNALENPIWIIEGGKTRELQIN
jgi:hypothetical protein